MAKKATAKKASKKQATPKKPAAKKAAAKKLSELETANNRIAELEKEVADLRTAAAVTQPKPPGSALSFPGK